MLPGAPDEEGKTMDGENNKGVKYVENKILKQK